MSSHMVVITREKAFYGSAIKHSVELDGISVGTLKNGESLSIHTTAGPHMISFFRGRKQEKSVSITIGEEDHITRLSARITGAQKLEVFIPPIGGTEWDAYPRAKKKSGVPLVARAIIATFAAIILIVVLFGEESPENLDTTKETDIAELTDEEKATAHLEKATEQFQNGNYMDAIDLCNDILSEYTDTDIAQNMSSYLDEQFSQYPHYTAKELMQEYDANIVNADEEYTDVVMVVSGTINSISKTNNDKNLAVILESGTYFYGVQLNFKTSQTESVATLNKGDKITAVGKCSGKSGTQLVIFEGNNVMIGNCYLIDN